MPNQYTKKKDILSKLFTSKELHKAIEIMLQRNSIPTNSQLLDDFVQETFIQLMKKPARLIIDLWNKKNRFDQTQLLSYACKIAIRRGFSKPKKCLPGSPNNNWKSYYTSFSNLTSNEEPKQLDSFELPTYMDELFSDVKDHLSIQDQYEMEGFLTQLSKKHNKETLERLYNSDLMPKIRYILTEKLNYKHGTL
jgi:hypothetical protein